MKRCVFCPTEAEKLSGEHIWDAWLNKKLPTKGYSVRKKLALDAPFREYPQKALNEKLSVVCEKCNNTWMSDIANQIRKGFADAIVDGSQVSILPSGRALLAAFTLLKAVVADSATQAAKDELFFSTAARNRFRTSFAIPPAVQMWIGSFYGERRYGGRLISGILTPVPGKSGPLFGIEFFTVTYVVGHLVLQLLAPRWKDVRLRGRPLFLIKPDVIWDSASVRFWPDDGSPIEWPLKHLNDDALKLFATRFYRPINMQMK
jgi:hypothetical protein